MSQQLYNFESPTLASEPSDTTIMILRERPSHHLLLVVSGMLAIAGTSSAEPSRLWEKPYVHEFESTASSLGYQPLKTWNGDKNVSGESTGHAISEIRHISGLTWEQLGQLFGVSRRSVHFWASGKPLNSANEARLMQVLDIVREANRGYARNTRAALFQATDSIIPFDLLVSERFEEARELLGKQASHEIAHRTKLSAATLAARQPLPPDELVGALQNRVHREQGKSRSARTVRNKRSDRS